MSPARPAHGRGANWSFQGGADAVEAVEARPVDVVCAADQIFGWHRPPARTAVARIVAVVAQHEVAASRNGDGPALVQRPAERVLQHLERRAIDKALVQPRRLAPLGAEDQLSDLLLPRRLAIDDGHALAHRDLLSRQADDALHILDMAAGACREGAGTGGEDEDGDIATLRPSVISISLPVDKEAVGDQQARQH